MRRAVLVVGWLLLSAHGRFPRTASVTFGPDGRMVVGTTFGPLLVDGDHIRWVCSEAVGYDDNLLDPDYVVAADGAIYATSHDGLRVSTDGGCTWESAGIDGVWTTDAVLAGDALWVTTWMPGALYLDGQLVDVPVAGAALRGLAVDGQRVVVGGYRFDPDATVIFVRDAGVWSERAVPVVDAPLYLLGAVDGDIYLREDRADGDTLHRSEDGGVGWTPVLESTGELEDIALLADGRVLVTARNDRGYVSTSTGSFVLVPDAPRMSCVEVSPDGEVFACGANWEPDRFAVGVSPTGDGPYDALFRFDDIDGPLACAPQICQERWVSVQNQLGIAPAPTPDASGGPDDPGDDGGCGCGVAPGLLILWPLGPLTRRRRRAPRP